ncbi:hypothetical protein E4U43_004105 [Claviceps pusilla]|uniref:Uncharacterized protein n=1 Tax=Claviceps pusilla TaxID=123648 RepID=A0A9P7T1X9_9HYPO|nr:hypothetical protein E4U43_004105 [Claviceps pusilla]
MAFASPQPDRDVEVVDQDQAIRPCRKRCISFINECGVHYSGERPPIPPPCGPITTPVQLSTGALPTPTSKDNCSTRTVSLENFCEAALSNDYLDDCDCLSDRVVGVFSVENRVERVQAGCRERKGKDR